MCVDTNDAVLELYEYRNDADIHMGFPSRKTETGIMGMVLCPDTAPFCAIQRRNSGNGGGI